MASWLQAYRGLIPQDYLDGIDPAERRHRWRRNLEHPGATVTLVANSSSRETVGFIRVGPSRDPDAKRPTESSRQLDTSAAQAVQSSRVPDAGGEVYGLYLRPDSWGQGAGRLLMTAGLRRLAAAGFRECTLWVLATNDRARRFYQAGGWQLDGATKTDDSRGFPLFEVRYRHPGLVDHVGMGCAVEIPRHLRDR